MKGRVGIAKPASRKKWRRMERPSKAAERRGKPGLVCRKKHYRKCIGTIRRKSTQSGQMTGDVSAGTTGGVSAGTTGKV